MAKKAPAPKIVIDQQWIDVLRELDKKLMAKNHDPLLKRRVPLGEGKGWGFEETDLSKLDNEALSFLELTAIASTKDSEEIGEEFTVTYEEDEDCDYKSKENDILRGGMRGKEIFNFEVDPLNRTHPQMVLSYGLIVAKTHAEAKAELMALPDAQIEKD